MPEWQARLQTEAGKSTTSAGVGVPEIIALDDLRVIAIAGPDRVTFLQGQLTQDVQLANGSQTLLAGWADARGRLLFAGHLFVRGSGDDSALALLVPAEQAPTLLKRLGLYVLRARVQLTLTDVPLVGLLSGDPVPANAQCLALAGDASRRLLVPDSDEVLAAASVTGSRANWELADIRAGIPTIHAATTGEFVPQMVNLDLLGAISFTKGCYTGQEIVARMKYLGRVKRRMLRFGSDGPVPEPGAALFGAEGKVGQVVRSASTGDGAEFLAVIQLDALPGPFYLDEQHERPVRRLELPYAISE